ncbi:MAG: YjfB family protein [Bacteroidota bacterium]
MDVSSIGSLSSALSQASAGDAAGNLVLKKAMEVEAQSAAQLLQALPPPSSNPQHLGNSVDVKA